MKYIITGGHTGMGLELTKTLLSEGHKIGLIVRSESRKEATQSMFGDDQLVDVFVADLSKRDQITTVASQIITSWNSIDGLFNNAGVLLDKLYYSDYGNELQLEVNAISPYLLTKALLPPLEKGTSPFVVSTATASLNGRKSIDIAGIKKPKKFTKLTGSYMDSKLVLVLLMNYLSTQHQTVRFASVNPGAIKTKMTAGDGMPFWLKPIRNLLFKSPAEGAKNLYHSAFSESFTNSGTYISKGKEVPMSYQISEEEINELLD
ncbi:MAG: SDR family NAD(P)-dependent oxidoreductase [Bacteroidota bacterium]